MRIDRARVRSDVRVLADAVLPPAVASAARVARRRLSGRPSEWERVPGTPADHAPALADEGWSRQDIAHRYSERWPAFAQVLDSTHPLAVATEYLPPRDLAASPAAEFDLLFHNNAMTFAYALANAALGGADRVQGPLAILDWGGAAGQYAAMARALFPELRLDYHVRDLPLMVETGRRLAPGVTFWEDDRCFDRTYDLVLASGSLHYAHDWAATLANLARASRGFVLVHQLPIVFRAASFAVIQRAHSYGYDTEYAGWCLRRDDFLAAAAACGLVLRRELLHGFRPDVVGAPERPEYRGYLFATSPG